MSLVAPLVWDAQLDPDELKDYKHLWTAEMAATSDSISTSEFILPSDAIAAGLLIDSQSAVTNGGAVFFEVDEAARDDVMWDGVGTQFRIRHSVTTAGGRRLECSIYLTVANK